MGSAHPFSSTDGSVSNRARIAHEVAGPDPEYTPRNPTDTLLYRVLHQELEPFLQRANERGQPAPRFVEQTLRAYLRCGVLAHGFLRLHGQARNVSRVWERVRRRG